MSSSFSDTIFAGNTSADLEMVAKLSDGYSGIDPDERIWLIEERGAARLEEIADVEVANMVNTPEIRLKYANDRLNESNHSCLGLDISKDSLTDGFGLGFYTVLNLAGIFYDARPQEEQTDIDVPPVGINLLLISNKLIASPQNPLIDVGSKFYDHVFRAAGVQYDKFDPHFAAYRVAVLSGARLGYGVEFAHEHLISAASEM